MIEIKFRGKTIPFKEEDFEYKGEWVFGYFHKTYTGECFIIEISKTGLVLPGRKVIPESVGQLWSPSEKLEFYSGDLFTAVCSPSGSNKKIERLCKVTFDGRGMNVVVWHQKEWWHYGSMNFTTAKIIGNIQDNPELLK